MYLIHSDKLYPVLEVIKGLGDSGHTQSQIYAFYGVQLSDLIKCNRVQKITNIRYDWSPSLPQPSVGQSVDCQSPAPVVESVTHENVKLS